VTRSTKLPSTIKCPHLKFLIQKGKTVVYIPLRYRTIPPSFTRKLKETHGVLASSVVLECKVAGSPPLTVAWFHNGHKLTIATLVFNQVDSNDSGEYICKAENSVGEAVSSALLSVQAGGWTGWPMSSNSAIL
uniref:Ig-like domain-containing protein n=1 Tax=Anolis carolinensis TaxID=28377 RepID=A0A803T9A4_ANOCA